MCNPGSVCERSGGVMLVHDIQNNKTQVIDFRETAPASLREEMLEGNLKLEVGYHLVPVTLRRDDKITGGKVTSKLLHCKYNK